MNKLLPLYKPLGLTPLQLVTMFRETFPEYKDEKIGYAGRLDPLASGVMLLMIGDATKDRDRYLQLSKSYSFEVIFGLETDTYDVLGIPRINKPSIASSFVNKYVNLFVHDNLRKQTQPYPPFSSKAVSGKPLFWWAKENRLDHITIPQRDIEIYQFSLESLDSLSARDLLSMITINISKVHGDFRQTIIVKKWQDILHHTTQDAFLKARLKISCSSGTYVRGLTHALGQELTCGATTISILRTQVGNYSLKDALCLPQYEKEFKQALEKERTSQV